MRGRCPTERVAKAVVRGVDRSRPTPRVLTVRSCVRVADHNFRQQMSCWKGRCDNPPLKMPLPVGGILKSPQWTRSGGWSAEKRDPPARRTAAPSLALRHPCCPIDLAIPDLPKEAKGAGLGGQRLCWSTPSGPWGPSRPDRPWWAHVPDGALDMSFGTFPQGSSGQRRSAR
jgi:hypothetical protein